MNTPAWTPGPWMATQNEMTGHFLIEQCPASTNVALTVGGIPRHEEKANADLLAASPELYAALFMLCNARNFMGKRLIDNLGNGDREEIERALAKARGESQ